MHVTPGMNELHSIDPEVNAQMLVKYMQICSHFLRTFGHVSGVMGSIRGSSPCASGRQLFLMAPETSENSPCDVIS